MTTRRASTGFTLLEVLVALALIASVMGGALAIIRQAIDTQGYLERRLFAQWVAGNVLTLYALGQMPGSETAEGSESVLGRDYVYTVVVTPVPPATDQADDASEEDGTEVAATSNDAEVVVEVREAAPQATPLARAMRLIRRASP